MENLYKMKFIAVLLFIATVGLANAQTIIYVSDGGSGDGSSWATTTGSIQDAIESASAGSEIWIHAGTYYVPGDTLFVLKEGVSLYGGFAGTETSPIQRTDFRMGGANETILSGDIDKNGINDAANATRVMYGEDITSATTLDGLTIRDGYADDSGSDGGGLRLNGGDMNISNCTFAYNYCDDNGAGLYLYGAATPDVNSCFFTANFADDKGGAAYTATGCNAVFTNCVFENNSADTDAGAFRTYKSSPTLINCTFTRNTLTDGDGSAFDANNALSSPTLINCVFWDNLEAGVLNEDLTLTTDATATLTNCAFQGTYTATGTTATGIVDISSTDPLFVNTAGTAGKDGYDAAADWDIQGTSVLIDAGIAEGAPVLDINYGLRDANPDIGAYEYGAAAWDYIIDAVVIGDGSVSPEKGYVAAGNDLPFILAPASGYEITTATYNSTDIMGSLVDNGNDTFTYTATAVAANGIVEVTFVLVAPEYTVTATAGANGSIDPSGDSLVTEFDVTVYTISPDIGYKIETFTVNSTDASGDLVSISGGAYTYTLSLITANTTIEVSFTEIIASISYVKPGGTGDGSSWANARGSIQDALLAGSFGDEVWVAAGTYLTPGELVDSSFTLVDGVSLYGGFAGTESSKDQRSAFRMGQSNETKLSADLDGNGFLTGGNGSRVIFGEYLSSATTIDGFTITGGFSDVSGSNGAGMKLRASSPNVLNCTFFDNYCDDGPAMYMYRSGDEVSSPMVKNCYFIKGYANDDGGAIYNASGTRAKFINCVFANNWANDEGGAIRNFECSPEFYNCTFVFNALPDNDPGGGGTYGPAIRNYQGSSSPYMNTEPKIVNCVFWRNQDGSDVRAYDISNTSNMANAGAYATIMNCALDTLSISSCTATEMLYVGPVNDIYTDLGFVNISGSPGYQGYDPASDWNLVSASILIAEGTNTEEDVPTTDIRGLDRGTEIDIGAYEYGSISGIGQFKAKFEFDVLLYPNPSNGSFVIEVKDENITEVHIIDITGRVIEKLENLDNKTLIPVNLNSGSKGLYFVKMQNSKDQISTQKLIIK